MIFLASTLLIHLLVLSLPEKSFATPIPNNNIHNTTARSVIQPRADWNKFAADIQGDQALIDKLNTLKADCDDDLLMPGVETAKQILSQRPYNPWSLPYVFYTSGMGEKAEEWAPPYFYEDSETWQKKKSTEWKFVLWMRAARLLKRMPPTSVRNAVYEQSQEHQDLSVIKSWIPNEDEKLQAHQYFSVVSSWVTDLAQKNEVQALAEVLEGDAYIAIPSDENPSNNVNGWNTNSAWGGWEFPALARNDKFKTLYRLDPTKKEKPVKIWERGDPKPDQQPKGNRQDIKFSGNFGDFFREKSKNVYPLQPKLEQVMGHLLD